ncbi:MAG TPA: NB-ARC domain-containing protein, partial [Candidatus Dormibacteraeota bacterium]
MRDTTPSFADLLRAYRAAAHMTQEDLAERSGLSVHAISQLERGVRQAPRAITVELLATALRLDAERRDAFAASARGRSARGAAPSHAPNQLPGLAGDFTGRERELAELHDLLTSGPDAAVVVAAISGRGGVGKSTLAVRAAHHAGEVFAGGRLYANLRGADPSPRDPAEALASLLRGLGVDGGAIPGGLDARAELYRSRLAGRRVLVVLDNAANERQVRPLLPGSAGCAVLITSRPALTGLEGAHRVELGLLPDADAVALLERVAGAGRASAEPETAREIVRLCDRLPLAVRVAGARLAARAHWPLSHLAERLRDERRRLDELAHGDLEVRASISVSYAGLGARERRVLRLLALLSAPDLPTWVVAAVLDRPASEAEDAVERLLEARLADSSGADAAGQTRLRLHDLVRLYTSERSRLEDPPPERRAALERTLRACRRLVVEVERRLVGGAGAPADAGWDLDRATIDALLAEPLAWFESERPLLVGAVELACEADLADLACELAAPLATCFSMRGHFDEWRRVHELVLAAARRSGNRRAQAVLERGLGDVHAIQDRFDEALGCFRRARSAFREVGDRRGEAVVLIGTGLVLRVRGCPRESMTACSRALDLLSGLGPSIDRVNALLGVGVAGVELGSHDEADGTLG